jgi:hypothetical protein
MKNLGVPTGRRDNYFYIKILIFILLLAWLGFLMAQKIDLVTADLGRHIKNGEWVVEHHFDIFSKNSPVHENFYSYTNPDFPTINHHWGAGVIFFAIHKLAGFSGLSLFYSFLTLATFALFFNLASRESNFTIATIAALFLIPLIADRREVRPEIFSYFLAGIFFFILWKVHKKEMSSRWLYILPIAMIFWVNLHVYFFLGLFLIGAYLFLDVLRLIFLRLTDEEFFSLIENLKNSTIVFILSILAALLNPFGWRGLFYPFEIFRNYGYTIVENKSVNFVENYGILNSNFFLVKAVIAALFFSLILLFVANRKKFLSSAHYQLLAIFFGVIAWVAVRNFTLLGFFALPVLAANAESIFSSKKKNNHPAKETGLALIGIVIFILALYGNYQFASYHYANRGIGLFPGNEGAADFLKEEKIAGPIFNDYDIGGCLIFNLPASEKVFVDNRPEAYPDSFFSDIYKPMQEKEDIFSEVDQKYNFNSIVFYRHDITPWGQNFLKFIQGERNWIPVYRDDYAIIYLKNNNQNRDIIEKFSLK